MKKIEGIISELTKTASADHILITGHSGAGKTTRAKASAQFMKKVK